MSAPDPTSVDEWAERLRHIVTARNPSLLLAAPPRWGKSALAQAVCKAAGWRYVDVTAEVLPSVNPPLGVFGPRHLYDWLRGAAGDAPGVCADEIEPLLAAFRGRQSDAENFFCLVRDHRGAPGLWVVTRFVTEARAAVFPPERVVLVEV